VFQSKTQRKLEPESDRTLKEEALTWLEEAIEAICVRCLTSSQQTFNEACLEAFSYEAFCMRYLIALYSDWRQLL
jgi:hypothetical protein